MFNGSFSGNYTKGGVGPGVFVAVVPSGISYFAFCGSWTGTIAGGGADHGMLALVIHGTLINGSARNDDGTADIVGGAYSVSGGDIICNFTGYALTGTLSGTTCSGSYTSTLGLGRSGTWNATQCAY